MRIGITGSTGVLGQALLSNWSNAEFVSFRSDISKSKNVEEWFENAGPLDGLIHLAALVPVDLVKADPLKAFEVNVGGTCNLLEVVRKSKVEKKPWIFYCSSSHIYETSLNPLKETSPINPISLYGQTKAHGDKWCETYRSQYKLPICVGRVFSYSSPKQPIQYFLPSMIQKIKNAPPNSTLEARGLHGARDFLTPIQIAQAIEFLFSKKSNDTFNIGTGYGVKLLDLVKALQEKLGRNDLKISAPNIDTNHLVANVDKLQAAGLKLEFNIETFLDYILDQ
jgi:nucleoside-diphosphate-sugar epimerase